MFGAQSEVFSRCLKAELNLITLKDLGYDVIDGSANNQKTFPEIPLFPDLHGCSMNPEPFPFCMETSKDLFEFKRLTKKHPLPITIPGQFSHTTSEPFSSDVSEYL